MPTTPTPPASNAACSTRSPSSPRTPTPARSPPALSGDLFVSRRTPSADYAHPLDDWDFDYIGNNIFRAYLAVGRHEDGSVYTRDDLDDHPDIRALFAYLDTIRTSGDALGTDVTADATYENREFELTVGTDVLAFEEGDLASERPYFATGSALNLIAVNLYFTRLSTDTVDWDDVDWDAVREQLVAETGTISGPDVERAKLGNEAHPAYASGLRGSQVEILLEGPNIVRKDALGSVAIGPGRGRSVYLDELDTDSNGDFMVPEALSRTDFATIHVREHSSLSGTQKLRFGRIRDQLAFSRENWELEIHNRYVSSVGIYHSPTAVNPMFTVRGGERCGFALTRNAEGGGEYITFNTPTRVLLTQEVEAGDDFLSNCSEITYTDTDLFIMPFEDGSSANSRVDGDIFTLGATEVAAGTWNPLSGLSVDNRFGFRVAVDGWATLEYEVELELAASGTLPDFDAVFFRQPRVSASGIALVSSSPEALKRLGREGFSGNGKSRRYEYNRRQRLLPNYQYLFGLEFPDTLSVSQGSVRIIGLNRLVSFDGSVIRTDDGS